MCIHTECILANYVQFVSSAFSQSTSIGGLKPVNYIIMWNDVGAVVYVTRFAKTQHNDAFLEFQIFASMSFMYLKLCSVAISMLYC